jgi:hypothetical protein
MIPMQAQNSVPPAATQHFTNPHMNISSISSAGATIHDYKESPMNPPPIPGTNHGIHTTSDINKHSISNQLPDASTTFPNIIPMSNQSLSAPQLAYQSLTKDMTHKSTLKPANSQIASLPKFIQEYVEMLYNVEADGHCGFRAAAICLGMGEEGYMEIRKKMIEEIHSRRWFYQMDPTIDHIDYVLRALTVAHSGSCNQDKWMSMPSMASPLANAFETPVFFFSPGGCYTAFPEFISPITKPPITIALMAKHFYAVEMKNPNFFPAPLIARNLFLPPSNATQAWRQKYHKCFLLMDNINQGCDVHHMDLT